MNERDDENSIMGGWLQKMASINQHDRGRTLLGKKREIRGSRDSEYDGREWGICPDGELVVHGSVR